MGQGPGGHPMGEVMNMKLTQKESMLLQDLKTSEEICIEKYGQYAEKAEDVLAAVDDEDLCACIRAGFAGERMDLFRRDCRVSSVLEAVERAVG